MSRLDDVIDKAKSVKLDKKTIGWAGWSTTADQDKEALKDLILELIGHSEGTFESQERDKFKAKLRSKVAKL